MLKLHTNEYGQVVFISLFNVSVFSSSRDTWHRVVDMEDQGGIVHYLNYKFVVFVSILSVFFFFLFSINDKIEPNKNGNLVDSSVSTMRTTQKNA
jgi:surface polysaccharide O-acyltransferase-like enzyme